ncbi:regulator of G-protein signaling 19 isoform X3 [Dunckerocampus dactyliophorus]|uniref:regulator of G-protein signaling 19 isoform X3 n=1 Tax=Dunckerocampus dactyliophorus TaxID=161453 RepID=UPI002406F43F|nr:regulator of G-protein signaling 19 isoform X3 [Dunckerocampus dactyliophorus]
MRTVHSLALFLWEKTRQEEEEEEEEEEEADDSLFRHARETLTRECEATRKEYKKRRKRRMCLRTRGGCRPPDLLHANIYTGPIPAERGAGELAMGVGRSETSALSGPAGQGLTTTNNSQRPSACCFCWCCCCSCSCLTVRNEDEGRRRRRKRISQDTKMKTIPNCEACTKPSVEEMRLWSQSFDKLMRNPAGRNIFREFLRTEYSEENMLFWLACEDLKQEINKARMEEKVRSIYEDYISILSPKEVSLDARVREVINKKMQDPTPHTFEDAQLQIYTLMHRDSYPRFLSSNIYRSLVHAGSRSSSES